MAKQEGLIFIDNGAGPTLPREALHGRPFFEGQSIEIKSFTCGHCQTIMAAPAGTAIGRCTYCDNKVCDLCAGDVWNTGVCSCVTKRIDDLNDAISTGKSIIGLRGL